MNKLSTFPKQIKYKVFLEIKFYDRKKLDDKIVRAL